MPQGINCETPCKLIVCNKQVIFLVPLTHDRNDGKTVKIRSKTQLSFNVFDGNLLYIITSETSLGSFAITRVDFKTYFSDNVALTDSFTFVNSRHCYWSVT